MLSLPLMSPAGLLFGWLCLTALALFNSTLDQIAAYLEEKGESP